MKQARHTITDVVCFHLYEVPRLVKFIETERRMVVARGWEEDGMGVIVFCVFFLLCHAACRILVSQLGIKPEPPALGAQSLHHWTARDCLRWRRAEFHFRKMKKFWTWMVVMVAI